MIMSFFQQLHSFLFQSGFIILNHAFLDIVIGPFLTLMVHLFVNCVSRERGIKEFQFFSIRRSVEGKKIARKEDLIGKIQKL